MLSLLIMLVLVWNVYIGYNRGIILQSFYTLGALFSLLVAHHFYVGLAHKITLWVPYSNPAEGATTFFFKGVDIFDLSKVYYAGIAFFALFLVTYALIRLIGVLVHLFPIDYFDNQWTKVISGGGALLVSLLFMSMVLSILATVPMPFIQNHLHASSLSRLLIEQLPPFTTVIHKLWVQAIV
ncbi:UNVERIFIED_CONTAM: CvpA family protein [Streptococcus canis]|uniref:CvpA family protein n=2 Tax=Streptococcus canis TaxID=1329 RepID=A0AAE4Q6Y8_STRCB|nr:CvpA family protein [Streptococcus canis]EIQ82621.1 colicin V production protein [Streptococcus canis FSL Z3-227]MDV5976256.1 CvpA family protein [Streptococcus canis]MDV5988703.1 CvpA family protein [Streptococcus canis]MDV5993705.1 CvpA family protein [Streptococcus canis]MDV6000947.1 CvpA family protein [Streptococcus canis]